jgi:hypothetical protein
MSRLGLTRLSKGLEIMKGKTHGKHSMPLAAGYATCSESTESGPSRMTLI